MRFAFCLILALLTITLPAHAEGHKDELKKVQADLEDQKSKQAELAKSRQDLEQKMKVLQKQLLELSKNMRQHEQQALEIHDASVQTESDIAKANDELQLRRKSLATTIMALERLNQMPPQAVLARPSAPIDMARSFDLLQKVIPAVSEQAIEVKQIVKNLQDLHEKQNQQAEQLKGEQDQLAAQQKELDTALKERKNMLAQNNSQQKEITQKVTALSNKATDLQDLLAKVEEQARRKPLPKLKEVEQTIDPLDEKPDIVASVKTLFDHVVSSLGAFHLPVTGHIATGYGQNTSEGVTSQGITIAARSGSIVTAPSAGTVRFAGPFRQYKLLVIIQHPNGDHSLIGGMQELYTNVGAKVAANEPIGKLPENDKLTGDSNAAASLYYERRHDGKPIDPRLARG